MPCCAAINCSRKDTKESRQQGYTFHRFPHLNAERLKRWLVNMKRDKYYPSLKAVLCSAHFNEDCFYRHGNIVSLNPDAVPTGFDFPKHLQKKPTPLRSPRMRSAAVLENQPINNSPPEHRMEEVNADDGQTEEQNTVYSHQTLQPLLEHNYYVSISPRKLKRQLDVVLEKNEHLKKKLKASNGKIARLNKKVISLKEMVDALKKQGLLSPSCEEIFDRFTGATGQLLQRALNSASTQHYPDELKTFALTLQFYSSKAYNFVRETFNLALPSQSQIRKWYSSAPGSAGFTSSAFVALQQKVEKARADGKTVIVALVLDEMSTRKHLQWDGKKFHGYVSVGQETVDDSASLAKNALVLMAVSVTENWKIACGYFLIDSMTGSERANLVCLCITYLHDIGVDVVSLTCDGPSCHFAMAKELGASLDPNKMLL